MMLANHIIFSVLLCKGHVSRYWPQSIIVTASKRSFISTATIQPPSGTARQSHKTARCKLPSHTHPNRSPSATDSRHSKQNDITRKPHLSLNTEVTNVTLHDRVVEVTVTNSGQAVVHWLEQQEGVTAFGVDVEWRPNFAKGEDNPVALLQIGAGGKCLLVQLLYIDYIPRALMEFLAAPAIAKVGVQILGDLKKLNSDYGFLCEGGLDLSTLAQNRNHNLKSKGLKVLALEVAGYSFRKDRALSMSDWSRKKLADQQVRYAANDAWASWLVYHTLLACTPPPPPPPLSAPRVATSTL